METFTARTDRAGGAAAQLLAALPIALFLVTRTATFFTPLILQEGSPLTVNEGSGIYSLCLLASLLVLVAIIVFREKLVPLTENIRLVSIVACALGFIGYLLLFLVRPTEIWSILVFIFGLVATSLYCAIYIIVIGEVLSSFGFRDGLLTVAIIGICLSIIHLLDLALVSKIATSFFIIATPLLIGLLTDFSTIFISPIPTSF